MRRMVGIAICMLLLVSCGGSALHDKMNGTWNSSIAAMTLDFKQGTVSMVGMGHQGSETLAVVSETGNTALLRLGTSQVTATLQDVDHLLITGADNKPVLFTRAAAP